MNSQIVGLRVASVIFGVVGLAHLLRILFRIQLIIGDYYIHRRWNAVAALVCAFLAGWLWRLSTTGGKSATGAPSA